MKQNKYDNADFFAKYSQMPRSVGGLNAAGEWPAFQALLPTFRDKRVLDIGCGFGWHCRYVREQGASSVVGIDLSENMLARARASTDDKAIEYRRIAIEDMDFSQAQFDVVISSLALHYVADFLLVCRKVAHCLVSGGWFVFSVEHPVFTAVDTQDWYCDEAGTRLHWPVDNYQMEGRRQTRFLGSDVVKYHRTMETYVNALIDSGFNIARITEPKPTEEMMEQKEMKDEVRRPMFLIVAAVKHD